MFEPDMGSATSRRDGEIGSPSIPARQDGCLHLIGRNGNRISPARARRSADCAVMTACRDRPRSTLAEQLEPGDGEVPVECECMRHLVSTHDLEADGVDEGELLIGVASQPSDDRLALEVR